MSKPPPKPVKPGEKRGAESGKGRRGADGDGAGAGRCALSLRAKLLRWRRDCEKRVGKGSPWAAPQLWTALSGRPGPWGAASRLAGSRALPLPRRAALSVRALAGRRTGSALLLLGAAGAAGTRGDPAGGREERS